MAHPPFPLAALAQHIGILGKTRSGKSTALRGVVEGMLERGDPVCIIDPKGDWWGLKISRDGKAPGFALVIFGGDHADVPINEHSGAAVAELFATGNRPCLIDLGGWMPGPRTRFWVDFAAALFRLNKGQRWLVVDEIHNFAPKGKVMDPDAGKALHWTNRLASEGLGRGIAMLFASQRPQKVHNDTLTQAETLIGMRLTHPADVGAITDWIKTCGDAEAGKRVLGSLAQLERGYERVWRDRAAEIRAAADLPICRCGLTQIRNPHADAGKPDAILERGAMFECIPCLAKSRHKWSQRAMQAEGHIKDARAKLADLLRRPNACTCGQFGCCELHMMESFLNNFEHAEVTNG